jgi:AcrR family transcriptional regulator
MAGRVATAEARLPEAVTPAGTRGEILRAALILFAGTGFHGTSIRDIAAKVGITSASLYAHYPAKEQILAELVRLGHEELLDRLRTALADAGPEPAAQLAALVRAQVLVHTEFPLLAVVANNELHALSPELAGPALALREQAQQLLLTVLRRGRRAKVFDVSDVVLAGTAIGGMGLRVANWYGPDQPYRPERVADAYAEFALRIVKGAA